MLCILYFQKGGEKRAKFLNILHLLGDRKIRFFKFYLKGFILSRPWATNNQGRTVTDEGNPTV